MYSRIYWISYFLPEYIFFAGMGNFDITVLFLVSTYIRWYIFIVRSLESTK